MRILYHHRTASKDGQYVHIEAIIHCLQKLGHEVIVVSPQISESEFGGESGTVARFRELLPNTLYEIAEFCYSIVDFFKLIAAIIKHKPDCIYERYNLYFPSGIWAKKLFRLPMLLEVNAPLYEERKKHSTISLDALAKWSETYAWRNADHLLPVTEVLSQAIKNSSGRSENITVIPNGVHSDEFYPMSKSDRLLKLYGLENKTVIGFVGFIREWHGLDRVIDVLDRLEDDSVHFMVVGDGPARESLEKAATEHGLSHRLTITGLIERDKMAEHLSVFDIALQPDVVAYASPLKLFEYMAMGKAILSIDSANMREVLSNNNDAILFENSKNNDFKNKLITLCSDSSLRELLGKNAEQTIKTKKYLWHENAKLIESILSPLILAHRPGK